MSFKWQTLKSPHQDISIETCLNELQIICIFFIKVRGNEPSQPQQMWCDILGGNEKLTLSDHKFQVQWGIPNSYVQSPGTIKYIAH